MCGILGEIDFNNQELNIDSFKKNIETLKNRGPDDVGYWNYENFIQLGFTRLSIIDLDPRSNQPMQSYDKNIVMVFNGEIYNYKELKNYLSKQNSKFKTTSDSEVILELYKQEGAESLNKLRGMFSIAICDLTKKKIYFLRDPFGIKPLYYFHKDNKFLFGSSVKSLIKFDCIEKKINKESLNFFYFFGMVKESQTIIENIKAFEPGILYEYKFDNSLNKKKLFDIEELFTLQRKSEVDLKHKFEENLQNHIQSDVPVAVLLSGGLDSSIIFALLNKYKANIQPFTLGFEQFKNTIYDEVEISNKFCKSLNVNIKSKYYTNKEILIELDKFFENMDQPTYDGLNTYLITKYLKQSNFKVALSGLGADEIFGGYNTFFRMRILSRLRFIYNNFTFKYLIKVLNKIFKNNKYLIFLDLLSVYNTTYQIYLLLRSKKDNLSKIEKKYINKILTENVVYSKMNLNDMTSLLEIKIYMKNQLLRDTDWASMANSVEIRVPFLDYNFLKFVKILKIDLDKGKQFIISKLANIPYFISKRRKTGFTVPYAEIVKLYNKKHDTKFMSWSEICLNEYFKSLNIN